ncbi:Zinc-binding alcohol dehydrogenase domain-containing protein cipB [Sphaceloma murrayae]|uniref:Zinc-binding alcohol dehydrogenase domain-containing protein cipB n=1 Tax=Sphaceloma murrayae TaxID=2082308 RepID=A0A2K1QKF2_9PEZI|nr:Zinc-binding alcohol dehydrogenase domain-containing protein cipB [Sphaceloma murrayae]
MKEAIVKKGPVVEIHDIPIPKAGPNQIVIKVVVSGSNPKVDWKVPEWMGIEMNQGDDLAGYVHELGPGSAEYGFKVGDRVAAFHDMRTPGGSYAEYGLAWAHTTFHLPDKTTFEEGASLPLAVLTATVGLYACLRLPEPWVPATRTTPLLVYGGASAVGAYVIKYARQSNIHPIIAVAGRGIPFVEGLIDREKGDTIVDYRAGDDAVVAGIKDALKGQKLEYAYDAVSENGSFNNIVKVLDPHGHITLVLPFGDYSAIPETVNKTITSVGSVHSTGKGVEGDAFQPPDNRELGYVHCKWFTRALKEGKLSGHPTEVVPGGLTGIEGALKNLKEGKASAVKYVFRIADTPGLSG